MGEIQAEPSAVASALNSDMTVDLANLLASVAPQKHENIIEGNRHLELAFAWFLFQKDIIWQSLPHGIFSLN